MMAALCQYKHWRSLVRADAPTSFSAVRLAFRRHSRYNAPDDICRKVEKTVRRLFALLMTLFLCFSAAFGEAPAWSKEDMDAYTVARFRERRIVGGAVIIARDGEILYAYDYGWKNAAKTQLVTLDTCFHAASVTKMVSAIGLMQLIEKENIPLDTPVMDVVGFPVANPAFPDETVTIRQVLSHTSGLCSTDDLTPNWEKLRVKDGVFSATNAPGTAYEYSNLNGGLIGAMIEALSGQSVNTYMRENVFEPLGINAAYHPALLPDQSDIAPKLKKNGSTFRTAKNELATFRDYNDTCDPRRNTDNTSGHLYTSVNGLIRVAMMLENGGEIDGVRILRPETIQLMMSDQRMIPGSSVAAESRYGLCLARVDDLPGGAWYGHQGRWQGLTSNAYFQPDTGLSIVIIASGYSAQTVDEVVTIARDFMEKAQELIE